MELEFDGRASRAPLEFSPEHQHHTMVLRNVSCPSTATLFKVQCTAPRKLRVRPALGLLASSGDTVDIQVLLSSQECTLASCKLLVVGRSAAKSPSTQPPLGAEQLKVMWAAAEAQGDQDSLVIKEMVNIQIHLSSDVTADHDKAMTLPQLTTARLTTMEVAELVMLLMKSQSRRQENALTDAERERLLAARTAHPSDWPCWEEYAARMRKLLKERNKRKTR
ncbi:Vesicle-associated membrane protein-associated protein A [Phytophthora cinnamomi]|uniref:Vesicle-associated membrane protein-associated protein A n=1 Tax=Phytophthora cinnamomi TaxID=4785 RepID=UPI00355AB2C0|nr:Vesicle-associated membrane protein-associated protein A [Phytophthora cinnamomi]